MREEFDMSFDPSILAPEDQEMLEKNPEHFATIMWVNGSHRNKRSGGIAYTGGFFMDGSEADLSQRQGWQPYELVHRNGNTTEGFAAQMLKLAVVRMRRRWEVFSEVDGTRQAFAQDQFEQAREVGRPTSRLHLLSLIAGLDDLGLMQFTCRGMIAREFTYEGGLLDRFNDTVIRAANIISADHARQRDSAPLRWPRFAMWMPISPSVTAGGDVRFVEVGKGQNRSTITPPDLFGIADDPAMVALDDLFVGRERYKLLRDLWKETEGWATAWDSLPPGSDPSLTDNVADPQNARVLNQVVDAEDSAEHESTDVPF
jgi:hypothetical protein